MNIFGTFFLVFLKNTLFPLIQTIKQKYGTEVPLILMNSFNTESATLQYLEDHNKNLRCFEQSKCPRIDAANHRPIFLDKNCDENEK